MENTSLLSDTIRFNVGGGNDRKMRRVRDVRSAANGEYRSNCSGRSVFNSEEQPNEDTIVRDEKATVVQTTNPAPAKNNTILGMKPMTFVAASLIFLVAIYVITNKE